MSDQVESILKVLPFNRSVYLTQEGYDLIVEYLTSPEPLKSFYSKKDFNKLARKAKAYTLDEDKILYITYVIKNKMPKVKIVVNPSDHHKILQLWHDDRLAHCGSQRTFTAVCFNTFTHMSL